MAFWIRTAPAAAAALCGVCETPDHPSTQSTPVGLPYITKLGSAHQVGFVLLQESRIHVFVGIKRDP